MGNCVTKVTKPNVIDASGSLRACAGHQSGLRQPFTQCGNFLNMTTALTPDKLSFAAHVDTTLNSKAGTKSSTTSNDPIETPSLDGIMCPFLQFQARVRSLQIFKTLPLPGAHSVLIIQRALLWMFVARAPGESLPRKKILQDRWLS